MVIYRDIATSVVLLFTLGLGCNGEVTDASHQRFGRGECAECHDDAPTYHLESSWELSHGRVEDPVEHRCASCHPADTCASCHGLAPASHVSDFRHPGANSLEAERHAALGRARPSACIVCHAEPVAECSTCHSIGEIEPWVKDAKTALGRWTDTLNVFGEP